MPQTPQQATASQRYADGWRAVGELIRSDGSWSGRERNKCFRNSGDGTFEDVSYVAGMDFAGDGRGQAAVDYDHDGDLDLILVFRTGPQLRVMRNELGSPSGKSLFLDLAGSKSNRDAVGARAVLTTNRRKLTREILSGTAFLSQPSRRIHFGLESRETPQSVLIRWPDGKTETFDGLPASGMVRIEEGAGEFARWQPAAPAPIEPPPATYRPTEGTWLVRPLPAPVFTAKGLDGEEYSLASFKDRKVLLNFWSTSCPPCRGEFQDFSENAEKMKALGLDVLAISVDGPDEEERVRQFASEFDLPFAVLLGNDEIIPTYSTINRYLFNRRRDLGVPTSFLVNEAGMIVKTYVGVASAAAVLADAAEMQGPPTPFPGQWVSTSPGRDYLEMATALAQKGQSDDALVLFEHAVAEGKESYELFTNFAAALAEEGYHARAESYYRKSLEIQPGKVEAVANLSTLLVQLGRPEEARELLAEVLLYFPDDAYLLHIAGTAEFQLDNLLEAETLIRKAVVAEPRAAEYRYNLAAVLASMGRRFAAIEEFENAAQLGRGGADLHNNLGALYMETNQTDRAVAQFELAVAADPNDYGGHVNLAIHRINSGDASEGLRLLREAQRISPNEPGAFMVEAEVLLNRGDRSGARIILERLTREHPEFAPAQSMLQQIR